MISGFHISILFRNGVDVVCDWTVQWTTGHCVPPLAQDCGDGAMVGGAVAHCPDSFTEQRLRIAFLSFYIDTYCDECKIWKRCLYIILSYTYTFKLGCLVAKPLQFTDVRFVSCIHRSIDVKIEEPHMRRSQARHGNNITRQHSQFTAQGQQVH